MERDEVPLLSERLAILPRLFRYSLFIRCPNFFDILPERLELKWVQI
jgi:hypothetical protein